MNRDSIVWMRRSVLVGGLMVLGACGTPPALTPPPAAAPKPKPTLAQERQRIADLFEGTPVVLEIDRDGSLRAEVPLRFCFDPARAIVKAPLAALLDRLAGSPATRGGSWSVAAPGDPKSKGNTLALERAASARDYLVGRGADAARFSVSALGAGNDVPGIRVVVKVPPAAAAAR